MRRRLSKARDLVDNALVAPAPSCVTTRAPGRSDTCATLGSVTYELYDLRHVTTLCLSFSVVKGGKKENPSIGLL